MIRAEGMNHRDRCGVRAAVVADLVEVDGLEDTLALLGQIAGFGWIIYRSIQFIQPMFPIARLRVANEQQLFVTELK